MFRRSVISFFIFSALSCLQAGELPAAAGSANTRGDIPEYFIDIGDILEISVWGYDELTREVMVRPDGKISYLLVGDITARRQTTTSLAAIIELSLLEYVKQPKVTVILKKIGDRKIFLLGNVRTPGSYDLMQGEGLFEVLSEAGGFTKEAAPGEVKIFRKNTSGVELVDFDDLLSAETQSRNIPLQPGDVVYVPETDRMRGVFVLGQVNKPGLYELRNAPTLLTLIVAAGGTSADGTLAGVRVVRKEAGKQVILVSNLDRVISGSNFKEDISLRSGDIVYVSRSFMGDVQYASSKILPPLQVIYYLNYLVKEFFGLP